MNNTCCHLSMTFNSERERKDFISKHIVDGNIDFNTIIPLLDNSTEESERKWGTHKIATDTKLVTCYNLLRNRDGSSTECYDLYIDFWAEGNCEPIIEEIVLKYDCIVRYNSDSPEDEECLDILANKNQITHRQIYYGDNYYNVIYDNSIDSFIDDNSDYSMCNDNDTIFATFISDNYLPKKEGSRDDIPFISLDTYKKHINENLIPKIGEFGSIKETDINIVDGKFTVRIQLNLSIDTTPAYANNFMYNLQKLWDNTDNTEILTTKQQ